MNKVIELKTSTVDTVRQYLQLINGILNLTPIELGVLAEFINIYKKLQADDITLKNSLTFSSQSRKIVAKNMKFKSSVSVSNYVKVLKDKKILNCSGGIYSFADIVLPPDNVKGVLFKLI